MLFDVIVIVLLILLNGFFAMSEMAVVSARKTRLGMRAEAGSRGAKVALGLASDPAKFLASIQIGITLIGILSGAYSGATLAEPLGDYFSEKLGLSELHGNELALGLVVIVVTYLSLIVGELVPKQLALKYAEPIACGIAIPISLLAMVTRPIVFLLHQSNRVVLRLLGAKEEVENSVTQEEVKAIIAEGLDSGALEPEESQMIERVMRLDDFTVRAAMTHRQDIVWFDVDASVESVLETIERTRHSRYLVCSGSVENLVGIVTVKDVLLQLGRQQPLDLASIAAKPMCLSESETILHVLEEFKQSTSNTAVIVNGHGVLQGMVTLKDLMEAIIGTLPEPAYRGDWGGTLREDGSWLLDGGLSILEAEELLGISGMVTESQGVSTVGGFILVHNKRMPVVGQYFIWRGWRFEVVDMDRTRIDKVLVSQHAAQ
ncbi:MAG: hemolysin family protein [Rickettsiales bacterium]